MEIEIPTAQDWIVFRQLAQAEGWLLPEGELDFYRSNSHALALVLKAKGAVGGLVTGVRHGPSGWIGNLIVEPRLRGRGLGSLLLDRAILSLESAGCQSLWLTASEQGRPLYERRGFEPRDTVVRWSASGLGARGQACTQRCVLEELLASDARGWGEPRERWLALLAQQSQPLRSGGTLALLQKGSTLSILGPWYSEDLCPRKNRILIVEALSALDPGAILVTDLLGSSPINGLMQAAGFERKGCTVLMQRGAAGWNPWGIVALGSLGSLG